MCFMNKPKINEKYLNTKITDVNFDRYLRDNYGEDVHLNGYKSLKVKPFLQNNYGEEGDCTLTSILTLVKFYKPELDENEVYDYIEKIAKKYLYNGKMGTFPLFNKSIIQKVFSYFGIDKKIISKYIKNIGFNENTIISQIQKNTPVIMSLTDDGREYYKTHTITIIGYNLYIKSDGKQGVMFRVYDN